MNEQMLRKEAKVKKLVENLLDKQALWIYKDSIAGDLMGLDSNANKGAEIARNEYFVSKKETISDLLELINES